MICYLNAKVGNSIVERVTGTYGLDDRYEQGDMLILFCRSSRSSSSLCANFMLKDFDI